MPEPDRSHPHSDSYTSAVPDRTRPLLLRLTQSCSLRFGFPAQWCVQPPNPRCAVVKISLTSKPPLFHPDQQGEPVVTPWPYRGSPIGDVQKRGGVMTIPGQSRSCHSRTHQSWSASTQLDYCTTGLIRLVHFTLARCAQAMPVISTALVCSRLSYLVLFQSCISNTFVILLCPLYSVMITHYLLITLYQSYWTHG